MNSKDFRYFADGKYGNIFAAVAPGGRFPDADDPYKSGALGAALGAIGFIDNTCRGFAATHARPNSPVAWRPKPKVHVRRCREVPEAEARRMHPALFELLDSPDLDGELRVRLQEEQERALERRIGPEAYAKIKKREAWKERNETAGLGEPITRGFYVEETDWRTEYLLEAFLLAAELDPHRAAELLVKACRPVDLSLADQIVRGRFEVEPFESKTWLSPK